MSSTHTPIRARRESAARRSILRAPTTSLLMRMSSTPPSTSASASDTFWQQTPTAPACICRRAMSGHLCVLAWVRTRTRPATARFKAARLRSKASRSRISAGVSTSARRWPTSAGFCCTILVHEPDQRAGHQDDERQRHEVEPFPPGGGDGHAGGEGGDHHHEEDGQVVRPLRLGALLGTIGFGEQGRGADVEEVPAYTEKHHRPPEIRDRDAAERHRDAYDVERRAGEHDRQDAKAADQPTGKQ